MNFINPFKKMWNSQKYSIIYMIVGLGLSTCIPPGDTFSRDVRIELMSGFPDGESGYDLGVSGCYAGKLGDFLIMAGGCNFPDKPLSEALLQGNLCCSGERFFRIALGEGWKSAGGGSLWSYGILAG